MEKLIVPGGGDLLRWSRRIGGDSMDGITRMVIYVMVWGLWRCSSMIILAFLPLTILALLLGLTILSLWRPLLELLLGWAICVYWRLARVRVVLPLIEIMIRVLRIADYTGRASGRWHWV